MNLHSIFYPSFFSFRKIIRESLFRRALCASHVSIGSTIYMCWQSLECLVLLIITKPLQKKNLYKNNSKDLPNYLIFCCCWYLADSFQTFLFFVDVFLGISGVCLLNIFHFAFEFAFFKHLNFHFVFTVYCVHCTLESIVEYCNSLHSYTYN